MTVLQYNNFYYKYGIRKASHFLTPRIWSSEDIMLPFDTELHWFTIRDVIEHINKNSGLLKNINKGIVHTVLEYDTNNTTGNFRLKPGVPNSIISEFAKTEKRLRFLKYKQDIKITNRIVELYSYGALTSRYIYMSQPLKRLHVYNNSLNTLITTMFEKVNRNIFVKFDIPTELPSRVELDRYSRKLTNKFLKLLPNYKYLNVVELWKFLTPELKENSILNRIPVNMYDKITFVVTLDNKSIFLNLATLISFVEEYSNTVSNSQYTLKPVKANMARKLLYIFLYRIIKNSPMADIEEVTEVKTRAVTSTISNSTIGNTPAMDNKEYDTMEIDIDKLLSTEIEERVIEEDIEDENNDSVDSDDFDIDIETDDVTGLEILSTANDIEDLSTTMNELVTEESKYNTVMKRVEALHSNKLSTKKDVDNVKNILEGQSKKPSPYGGKETIGQLLDMSTDKLDLDEKISTITDNVAVLDKSYNKNKLGSIKKQYMRNQYRKDMIRTIFSLQNHNSVIEDYNVEVKENILGATEEHNIKLKTLGSGISNVKLIIPKVDENGVYTLNGNSYLLRQQRADLPIRKIDFNNVALSTFYGKTFVTKASTKANDSGYWLLNQILKLYSNPDSPIRNLVTTPPNNEGLILPSIYSLFSRYIKSFKLDNVQFSFDYVNRIKLFSKMTKEDLEKVEKGGYYIVGNDKGFPIVMDMKNNFFKYNGKLEPYPSILERLGISINDFPIEFTSVRIYKKNIPTVVFLSYYLGLEKLLKILDVKYTIEPSNKQPQIEGDFYKIKFKDVQLIIKRDYGRNDLIIGGLKYLKDIIKTIDIKLMNNRNDFAVVFSKLELSVSYINEIKLMETMYVDPISLSILKQMKEPTNFKGLLIRANELLIDDNYKNPNSIDGMSIKGYERIPGMMYKELVTALKEYENKTYFSKSKLTVNPYSIMNKLNEDSTTVLIDDLNPMATLKQEEDVTYLGMNGRSKETLSRSTRVFNTNEVGIISEATRDSGDVGISAYLTADPLLNNTRGMVGEYDPDKDNPVNVYSTSAMLCPFILTDDGKRVNFSSIMNSHIIPVKDMRTPYVLTGYESIVPIRSSTKYVIVAEDDGRVLSVDNKECVVEYNNIGIKKYPIRKWQTKETSGSCYTHELVPNLSKGDRFIKDDTILYDKSFFEPSIFNRKRVIYKQGNVVTVALTEESLTDEDSAVISKRLSEMYTTNVTKVKSIVVSNKDNIINMVKPGDHVEPTSLLFTIVDSIVDTNGLDEKAMSILQGIKNVSPKAKVLGNVIKIDIRYNCEKDDLSDTLKSLVDKTDKELKQTSGFTGRVDNTYSIQGKPLMENEVELKIYIEVEDKMGIGDKGILSNQMKFTVGEVMNYNLNTLSNKPIDLLFSFRSLSARIVNSPLLIGTTSALLEKVTEDVVDMYFN